MKIQEVIFSLYCRMARGVEYERWEAKNLERSIETVRNVDVGLNAAFREYSAP